MISVLLDEAQIGLRTGIKINAPIRLFSLEGLGINSLSFLQSFAQSFESIPWDDYFFRQEQLLFLAKHLPHHKPMINGLFQAYYFEGKEVESVKHLNAQLSEFDQKLFSNILPDRKRTICKFLLKLNEKGNWNSQKLPLKGFAQNTEPGDFRNHMREFHKTSDSLSDNKLFRFLLCKIGELMQTVDPKCKHLELTLHQVGIVAFRNMPGDNAPEGIHQDGADYIISALVMERQNIEGGVSMIYYGKNKSKLFEVELKPGQGILHADKGSEIWHDVSPIYLNNETTTEKGTRNIFGFDINVIE